MKIEDAVNDRHRELVKELAKSGLVVKHEMTKEKAELWRTAIHMCLISGDALSRAKKAVIYNKREVTINLEAGLPPLREDAANDMTGEQADLLHAATGIATEALELLDMVASHVLCGERFDHNNFVEELGDLEFYMQQARNNRHVERDYTLYTNVTKLRKRYANGYSDTAAQNRADKDRMEKAIQDEEMDSWGPSS